MELKKEDKKYGKYRPTIILFLLFIFGMSVLEILTPKRAFSWSENRFLSQKPEYSKENLLSGEYSKDYEAYLTDQFPYRDQWIGIKVISELLLQKKEINGVYFGQNGYLIESHPQSEIDQEQKGRNEDRLARFISAATDLLGYGKVKVMMVPTANAVLTNRLPPLTNDFDQSGYERSFDERLNAMGLSHVIIPIFDPLSNRKEEAIYYKTDHHWTALGAYYAYQEWCRSSQVKPYLPDEFDIRPVDRDFYGTVYSKVNFKLEPDTIELFIPKKSISYQVDYNMGEKKENTLYDLKQLESKDKYAVYLGGNHALVKIQTNLSNGKKLLIVKDSYAHCFTPFVVNHFEEVQMIDLRYFNMPVTTYMQQNEFTDLLFLYNIPNFMTDRNMSNLK